MNLKRTKDGYFVGTNFPVNEKLLREETNFDITQLGESANARRVRATELVESARATSIAFVRKYLSDHYDSFARKEDPNERTLVRTHRPFAARVQALAAGVWSRRHGSGQGGGWKLVKAMAFEASFGHPCGRHFKSAEHLAEHPQFAEQKALLRDLDSYPWTRFSLTR